MKKQFRYLVFIILSSMTLLRSTIISKEISALHMLKESSDVIIPQEISLERAPTVNGYGYVFYTTNPIAQEFINESDGTKRYLEIGAGFSKTAGKCLEKGILEYTANDISEEHLKIMCRKLEKDFGEKTAHYFQYLKLLPGKVPDVLPEKEGYYDAILLDKVVHFFSPQELEQFLSWAHKALKKGGKLFIVTISPYCKGFNVSNVYSSQKINNDPYPWCIKDLHQYMPAPQNHNPNYSVPNVMLFFRSEDLCALLRNNAFEIAKNMTMKLPSNVNFAWRESKEEECDLVGIIAYKA